MTQTYYKATKPDGWDFATGNTINYATALRTNQIVKHPHPKHNDADAFNYLSISVEPGDCTAFQWDAEKGARLFEVEAVGRPWTPHASLWPNKRAVTGVRVIRELPAHMLFGPQGEAVVEILRVFAKLTQAQRNALYRARPDDWNEAWSVVRGGRAGRAGLRAARVALLGRLDDFDDGSTASGAALAVLLRHTIGREGFTQAHYDALTKPWVTVTGRKAHPEDVLF
jgi:hypothetical protein